ncbi:DUF441 family protein, partial [Erwinia amylovora]|uniref:DUF441 family protein n=1 Tax=Erwinia amylovora TaxID=552 RepID=UPI002961FB41
MHSFVNCKSLLSIDVGMFVSLLGGLGISFMISQPTVVGVLLIVTIICVSLLRGVPVGPLIAD